MKDERKDSWEEKQNGEQRRGFGDKDSQSVMKRVNERALFIR